MLPGVWSIDSLTSALCEAADGLETRATVPAVINACYQNRKKEKKSSLNESRQGRWEKEGGVGSDTYNVVGTADSKCDYMRFTACSTAFPATKHQDVLHNGHHLYTSCLSSRKSFRPHSDLTAEPCRAFESTIYGRGRWGVFFIGQINRVDNSGDGWRII